MEEIILPKLRTSEFLLIIVPLLVSVVLYPFLPSTVPRHFGINGEVSYISKDFIFIFSFVPFLAYKLHKYKERLKK